MIGNIRTITSRRETSSRCMLVYAALLVMLLSGCAASIKGTPVTGDIAPVTAQKELPEDELLNVAIQIFDPGELPEDEEERAGLSEEIRQAEANFLPVQLKYTLQRSGYWGSVWVVPDQEETADLMISGKIEYSDGESLALAIKAVDSRNVVWLDKTYKETSLRTERNTARPEKQDTFQDLFNAISNDLIKYRQSLSHDDMITIRRLEELRYAASMSEESFSRYYRQDKEGHYTLVGLPAENDPMLARVKAIRARDEMLMDTLSGYYDNYYAELWSPYQNWRKFRSDELQTMRKIKDEAFKRQVLGFAAIAGAIALGGIGGADAARILAPVRGIMAAGGTAAVYSGYQKRQEAAMNIEVIKELGESFASDARPLVVEINGETVHLTGTAREQYAEWRTLLKKIYKEETGFDQDLPIILGPEQGSDQEPAAETSQDVESYAQTGTETDPVSENPGQNEEGFHSETAGQGQDVTPHEQQ